MTQVWTRGHSELDYWEIEWDFGLRGIPHLGFYRLFEAQEGFSRHVHDFIQVRYLLSGSQRYRIEEQDYVLQGGEALVTHPGEKHGSGFAPLEPGMLFYMNIALRTPPHRFLLLPPATAEPLVRRIRTLPRHFACDDRLRRVTDELLNLFQSPPNDITRIAVHTALLTWLLALVSRGTENIAGRATPEMMRVLDLVDSLAALPEYPRMEALASAAGLSVSRLKTRFRRQLGIPPMEFVTRRKISLAMNRLRDNPDETVTQIAMDLGFASSQYFASVFRRITSQSPTAYRKALRPNDSAPDPKPAP